MITSMPTVQWQDRCQGVCQGQNTGYGSKEMWKVLTTSQRHLTGSPVCSTLQGCGNDLFWQVLQSYSCGSVRCFTGGNQQLSLRVGFSHSAFLTATLVIALKWVVIQQLWWQPGSTTLPAEEEKDASPWKCFISSWILFFCCCWTGKHSLKVVWLHHCGFESKPVHQSHVMLTAL